MDTSVLGALIQTYGQVITWAIGILIAILGFLIVRYIQRNDNKFDIIFKMMADHEKENQPFREEMTSFKSRTETDLEWLKQKIRNGGNRR